MSRFITPVGIRMFLFHDGHSRCPVTVSVKEVQAYLRGQIWYKNKTCLWSFTECPGHSSSDFCLSLMACPSLGLLLGGLEEPRSPAWFQRWGDWSSERWGDGSRMGPALACGKRQVHKAIWGESVLVWCGGWEGIAQQLLPHPHPCGALTSICIPANPNTSAWIICS